jgi:hypothetical protein
MRKLNLGILKAALNKSLIWLMVVNFWEFKMQIIWKVKKVKQLDLYRNSELNKHRRIFDAFRRFLFIQKIKETTENFCFIITKETCKNRIKSWHSKKQKDNSKDNHKTSC